MKDININDDDIAWGISIALHGLFVILSLVFVVSPNRLQVPSEIELSFESKQSGVIRTPVKPEQGWSESQEGQSPKRVVSRAIQQEAQSDNPTESFLHSTPTVEAQQAFQVPEPTTEAQRDAGFIAHPGVDGTSESGGGNGNGDGIDDHGDYLAEKNQTDCSYDGTRITYWNFGFWSSLFESKRKRVSGSFPCFPSDTSLDLEAEATITIRPDGAVSTVRLEDDYGALYNTAVVSTLYAWKFEALPPSNKQGEQECSVRFIARK